MLLCISYIIIGTNDILDIHKNLNENKKYLFADNYRLKKLPYI